LFTYASYKKTATFCAICVLALSLFGFHTARAQDGVVETAAPEMQDSWGVRCAELEDGTQGRCEAFRRVSVQETGQRLIELAIGFPEGQADARGVMVLPLGINLQEIMTMNIDDNAPLGFRPRYCIIEGCIAFLALNNDVITSMSEGDMVNITFQTVDSQQATISVSLDGFADVVSEARGS